MNFGGVEYDKEIINSYIKAKKYIITHININISNEI